MFDGPDWEGAKAYILERLISELPADLIYHSIRHTRDDVLPAAERLAALANLAPKETLLLCTAALYHDIGYTKQYEQNEAIAVCIARKTLPRFGYTPKHIEVIAGLIMATRMPQTPNNDLEELMCDADLDSLGRDDFFDTSHQLWEERQGIYGTPIPLDKWYQIQLQFLQSHTYFTEIARSLRDAGKQKHIHELKILIKKIGS